DAAGAEPEVGANVSTWSLNEGMNQRWVLIPSEDMPGYYRIASASNTLFVLDAAGAEPEIGANVSIWYDNGGANQLWKLVA
ncbi:MAG: RICIN domain-containing protein, partial [Eggerthellaceae bacterium]|nr:RICIN domain-containing protein [Eggerthellaceae bacterium]